MRTSSITRALVLISSLGAVIVTPSPAEAQMPQPIYSSLGALHIAKEVGGVYYPVPRNADGKLDFDGNNGDNAVLGVYMLPLVDKAFMWKLVPAAAPFNPRFNIKNEDTGMCMDTSGDSVVERTCTSNQSQIWELFNMSGFYQIRVTTPTPTGGRCATVNFRVGYNWWLAHASLPLIVQDCNNLAEQLWKLAP